MSTSSYRIANRHDPDAAIGKIYEWLRRSSSPTIFSLNCEYPAMMQYQSMAHANCWVTISYHQSLNLFSVVGSNDIATLPAKQAEIECFLDAINEKSLSPLILDPSDNAVWTMQEIELTDEELQDSEIERAFNLTCKVIDDSTLPILSMMYSGMSVQEAIATYNQAQAVPLVDWQALFTSWTCSSMKQATYH